MTGQADAALAFLETNRLLHLDMIESIRRKAEIIYAAADGVLLREPDSHLYKISVANRARGETLLEHVPECWALVTHQEFMCRYAAEKYHFQNLRPCWQSVYDDHERLPLTTGLEIRIMEVSYIPVADAHYDLGGSGYLAARRNAGELFGGFLGAKLCGFAGMHDDGAMGMLHVLEPWRGRGFGLDLAKYVINYALDTGAIPYSQTIVGNEISLRLQGRLGMTISKDKLFWMD